MKPRTRKRQPPANDYTNAVFQCPLCGNRVTSTRIYTHIDKKHAGTTREQMHAAVEQGLREGKIRFELTGRRDSALSGTKLLAHERKTNKLGVRALVRGGSPGLKKSST